MGADYAWHVNKIFFLHTMEEQFQIQGTEAQGNKSKPNKAPMFVKILVTESHLAFLSAALIAAN